MSATESQDLAVKRTAVKLLSSACDGVLDNEAPLRAALNAAIRSPNDPLFIYNYRVAEKEFRQLPREMTESLMERCQSRIAESQDDILAEIRVLSAAAPKPPVAGPTAPTKEKAPSKKPPARKTAVQWT